MALEYLPNGMRTDEHRKEAAWHEGSSHYVGRLYGVTHVTILNWRKIFGRSPEEFERMMKEANEVS